MKKNILAVLIVIFLMLPYSNSYAEEFIIKDNFNTYTPTTLPLKLKHNNIDAVSFLEFGNGHYSLYDIDENNKCIKSEITTNTSSDSTIAYILPSNALISETKDYFILSFKFKLDDKNRLGVGIKSGNNDNANVFILEENILKVTINNNVSSDSKYMVNIDPEKYYSIKIIFDVKNSCYQFYCNGKQVGDNMPLRTNVDWPAYGIFYITLKHTPQNGTLPANFYIDDLSLSVLNKKDVEISSLCDLFYADELTEQIPSRTDGSKIAFDVFNRTSEELPIMISSSNYSISGAGFSLLKNYKISKKTIKPGINRIESHELILPDMSQDEIGKIFLWSSLSDMMAISNYLKLFDDGTYVKIVKE